MVLFIFKENKRYMVFSSDAFGVSASHTYLLEDSKNYPYISIKNHPGVRICANRRSLALLYLRDILNDMDDITFDTLRDEAFLKLKEKLESLGQVRKGGRLLENLFIILNDEIYYISMSGAIIGISNNSAFTAGGIEKALMGYIDKHINEDILNIVTGVDNLLVEKNEIRRPPYFIVDLDNDNIERICL